MDQFTFADLFAGIGGMRIGFESAGGTCVLTSEWDRFARETYLANWSDDPKGHSWVMDVRDITRSHVPTPKRQLDVIVAGFPCQPYSIAGLRQGLKDERGGDIFTSLLRILKELKPKVFVLENVKGIIGHDQGRTFEYMKQQLEQCGYLTTFEVMNSMTHANIPQNRERVFIVGFRSSESFARFAFPKKIALTKTIQDCLETKPVDKSFYYDDRFKVYDRLKSEIQKSTTLYQWRRQYVRENMSEVCPTLTANMGSGGHNVPLLRDAVGIRKLTPRETLNFQGFPRSFKTPTSMSSSHLYHQAGNSVTVPLIRRLAKEIVKVL